MNVQMMENQRKIERVTSSRCFWCIKVLFAFLAISNGTLTYIQKEVEPEGMGSVWKLLGLCAIFSASYVSKLQRDKWISSLSLLFSICTVFGKSYHELGNYNYIFQGSMQLVLAGVVMLGYYLLYKNGIIFVAEFIKKRPMILRCEPKGYIEKYLFEKHAFGLTLLVLTILMIPYYIAFWPGTIHPDAITQYFQHFGLIEMSGHHPVLVTKLMGICAEIGKVVFHSDNIGVALYVTPQTICQLLIFSYTIWLFGKMKAPMIFRWMALLLYGVFPLFPMYAVTVAKDTGYYECMLLFVTSLMQLYWDKKKTWWNKALVLVASLGICAFRKEGKFIVIIVLLVLLWRYRENWKVYLTGIILCIVMTFSLEMVYMPAEGIEKGGVKEMLSIPLQQTARYIREHYQELSADEKEELQVYFRDEITVIAEVYDPEISDPVKSASLLKRTDGSVKEYLKVWYEGAKKHPATYVQALLNHIYGYFYPDRGCWDDHIKFFFTLVGEQQWDGPVMTVSFGMKDTGLRNVIEEYVNVINRFPVLKLLFSPGAYVYVLIGCIVYLVRNKYIRELFMLLPGCLVVAVCLISPVNAYLRYTFPLIVLIPVYIVWCYVIGRDKNCIS